MTDAFRALHRYLALLLLVAVIVQIAAAGYGAFYAADKVAPSSPLTNKQWDHGFNFHDGFGYIILLVSVVLFLVALGARLGKRRVLMTLALPLLVVLQIVLARVGESTPAVGALHPVNALVILGLTGRLTAEAWRSRERAATAEPASTAA